MASHDDIRASKSDATVSDSEKVRELMGARMMRKSPVLEEAWRYWSDLRRGQALPKRADLDPAGMKLILGHSLILDRVRPGTVRVRVGGRVPNDLMGMETRGLPVRAFFDLMQRSKAQELVESCFTDPATLELDLISEGADGPVAARMVLLPLVDAHGEVTKALAVLVPDRVATDGPRRFSILRHHLGALRHQPKPEAKLRPRPVTPTPAPQYDTPAPSAPVLAAESVPVFQETSVPWLKVVK